ncbi:hypothetical protein Pmani_011063 [Petrolisthes manimaculis]|uniref:DNA-dependent protein kinase catalytic subunit n=1 Tax=Petrolisthes manimaculis TaxID=1843537 RepID=A0AAE1UGL3_9EUCA|nr:hypothetical protein Pmani_011063 [Petrolisthes manimaculis]
MSIVESVQQLALSLVEHFPMVSTYRTFLAFRCLFALLHALSAKSEYAHDFIHTFVYRSIILTCSHAPEVDTSPRDDRSSWMKSRENSEGEGKWKGVKNETTTYRNFLPLWEALLKPEKVATIKVIGAPATALTGISSRLYMEYITCTLEITEKLDLSTYKEGELNEKDEKKEKENDVVTSDPISQLRATTPKDFQVYMNLVSVLGEVLPLQCEKQLAPHVLVFARCLVCQSSTQPLVSSHYTALTTLLTCAQKTHYFDKQEDPEVETTVHLLTGYIHELVERCRQYRDHLLASCLSLILSLPPRIVINIFPELLTPMQMALQMGVSYLPLAEVCISALKAWVALLPRGTLIQNLPRVLPLLLPYLRSQDTGGETEVQTRVIRVKMALAHQHRKVDTKRMKEGKQIVESAMQRVQASILQLIGSLDPSLSQHIIPQDPDTLAAAAVRWDILQHLKFAMPFEQVKIDVFLDDLLPIVVDLAVNSSDRQTKVAASELLHSIIILMIGTGSQQHPDLATRFPMAPLYRRIFPGVLQLACDPDQVTRQLFLTLAFQVIHWFTNSQMFENPDTMVLLEAIMEGIVKPDEPALRDVSAHCLTEFVKWSRKQSRQGDRVSRHLKSILKRIFSLCQHPSAFKRLGGCMAWNSIYCEFREDATAVDIWTLELLVRLVSCLALSHTDSPSLGTHQQATAAIAHVERIIRVRKEIFSKRTPHSPYHPSQNSPHRRVPTGLEGGSLEDVLMWLLKQCGRPQQLARNACMQLLVSLAPHAKGCNSARIFVENHFKKTCISTLVDIIEGGGEKGRGIRQLPYSTLHSQKNLSLTHITVYFEALLSSLDGYCWLIGQGIASGAELFNCSQGCVLDASTFFIDNMATLSVLGNLQGNSDDPGSITYTPTELDKATKLKCTVVVRMLDFISVLLHEGPSVSQFLNKMWTEKCYRLIICCTLDPVSVGFDIRDTEVSKHLPSRLSDTLEVMYKKMSEASSKEFMKCLEKELQQEEYNISKLLPPSLSDGASCVPLRSRHVVEGFKILYKSGWLNEYSSVNKSLASELAGWVCSSLFITRDLVLTAVAPHPSHHQFLYAVLDLAITLNEEARDQLLLEATDTTTVVGMNGKTIERGCHLFNTLGPCLLPHLLPSPDSLLARLMELVRAGKFLPAMTLASNVLGALVRNQELRKRHSSSVIQAFLYNWPTISVQFAKSSLHRESSLSLLSGMFLVDHDGILKKHCSEEGDSKILTFYRDCLCDDKVELQLKIRTLKMLPFFLTMTQKVADFVGEALDVFIVKHFPLQSSEFSAGGARDREHQQALDQLLSALHLSGSLTLLHLLAKLFCREDSHRYDENLQECLEKFIKQQNTSKQREALKLLYSTFSGHPNQNFRQNIASKFLMPLLQMSSLTTVSSFFMEVVGGVMLMVGAGVQGRSEEQPKIMVNKMVGFMLLQVLYSRLPREKMFAPGSEVNGAYRPDDVTGKEMTKEVFRHASKIAKGELRHDQTNKDLRRLCACAAYNTLIAVLVCVQNDLRFYTNFLFSANPTKGEAIWESLIDCSKVHEFDVEVNFNSSGKKRFVAVRRSVRESNQGEMGDAQAGTVKYMATHYLSDSSLSDDISQFDFTNSVVLAMSQRESQQQNRKELSLQEEGGELLSLRLDQSDYNDHEVMANLTAVVNHMVNAEILVLHKGDTTPAASDVPQWMNHVKQKLESPDSPRNVKLFLLRLMTNTALMFEPYAAHFLSPVLACMVDGTLGEKINYFLCDLIVMVMGWGKKAIPEDTIMGRNMVARVMRFLCSHTPHNRADVYKYNLDVFRCVVERWKNVITVPYQVIYALLEVKDGANREVEAGLQLLGVILVNGLPPFSPDSTALKTKCETLLVRLLGSHAASTYGAAAEVVGLFLKFLAERKNGEQGSSSSRPGSGNIPYEDVVVKKIMDMMYQVQGQAVTCIYNIHKHYPVIVGRFINKLLNVLPKLYGIMKTRVLECVIAHSASMEDVFTHLKEQNLLDKLARKEASTQLVSLQLVNAVMPRLTPPQMVYFIPGIVTFATHPAPKCRETMYDILFWVFDNYSGDDSSEGKQLLNESSVTLLKGVKEEDAALRQMVLNFWLESSRELSLPQRLLHIFQKIYNPESEDSFLQLASYILLEGTSRSADYQREIFHQPLSVCKFKEMRVSTAWQARHSSMIPLFAETQNTSDSPSSISSYLTMTQGEDMDEGHGGLGGVQATQANVFSATQQPGAASNWVSGSTFDTTLADMEFEASHAPTQGSTSGLLFTVGKSGKHDLRRYKQAGIGNTRLQPHSGDTPDSIDVESKLMRRRFVRNQDREKQYIHYVKLEERRSRLRETLEKERRSRREAQVTMYRQYRVGELPDVQIPHRALIAPLQALAQRDEKVARLVMETVVKGAVAAASTIMPDPDAWLNQLRDAIESILSTSYQCQSEVLRTALHLAIENDMAVDSEALTAACLGSRLEPLGILVLERQLLVRRRGQEKPPARKKARVEVGGDASPETSIWINMTELYKNLGMWDIVHGIVRSQLGDIKQETRAALEAEATCDHVQAFLHYRQALMTPQWDDQPHQAEVRVWEEWYASCASLLGQWSELEKFLEDRFLKDNTTGQVSLKQVWKLQRPAAYILPSLVNSKLMVILDEAESDRNLCSFVDDALMEPEHRTILEGELALQLAVLSVHQEKLPQAQAYLSKTTSSILHTLSQYSLLTPKPLIDTLRNVQLVNELGDFLKTVKYAENNAYLSKVRQIVTKWKSQEANVNDSPLLVQLLSSYRNLYLHFLQEKACSSLEECDIPLLLNEAKSSINKSVIKAALVKNNYHLAMRHLKKLKSLCESEAEVAQFYFLMAGATMLRGKGKPSQHLQYLVEAWSKHLGKVSTMSVLKHDSEVEMQYLRMESQLCTNICECIRDMGDDWHQDDQYMQVLADKFPGATDKDSWYEELLGDSYRCLQKAVKTTENKLDTEEKSSNESKDMFMTLAKYSEDCLGNWSEHINTQEYSKSLVASVLKAMTLGSHDAHYHFPRLINLMEEDTSLVQSFIEGCETVPTWMFLLWFSHILIYVDKPSGLALQPVVEKVTACYPQAVTYPFMISSKQYDFTSTVGKSAKAMCQRVENELCKNPLLSQFVSAISLLVIPYIPCKDAIADLANGKDKKVVEDGLKKVKEEYLMADKAECEAAEVKGEAHCKLDCVRREALTKLDDAFGKNLSKLKSTTLNQIRKTLVNIKSSMRHDHAYLKKLPRQLKSYSPWLANFQASKYPNVLELPGQYTGLSKPLPEYHVKISSFEEQIAVMPSLRLPMRIVVRGDDNCDHKYLVKWGEDLRTDQRIQQIFTFMNSVYDSSPLLSHTPLRPYLDTYQVVPLSLQTGILKWVESTQPLKDFMRDSFNDNEKDCYQNAISLYSKEKPWEIRSKCNRENVVKRYEVVVNKIPWDILRRGLVKLSSSKEGFFSLRCKFTISYATLCISHWLLGIGDRHCGNFLVSLKTGGLVGIDFGHHFETSAQFLPVPELMPFRLTPQISNIFQPLGHTGMLHDIMVAILTALQDSKLVLLAVLEAFIKEPTEDFLYFVRNQEGSSDDSKVELFSKERIRLLNAKLSGIHPSRVTQWAVARNKHVKSDASVAKFLDKVIMGTKGENPRADAEKTKLSAHKQVDILLEQATDPNILGRTWFGWDPFL